MYLLSISSLLAAWVSLVQAAPSPLAATAATTTTTPCPPLQGSFNVSILDLYPESADWDPINCKIYFGLYYNASVAVYDPYQSKLDKIITFSGITDNPDYTITGIDFNGNESMYFAATSYTAFRAITPGNASLANFTGPNSIIRYDLTAGKIAWIADLVPIHDQIFNKTGQLVTGFQDMAEDHQGNAYVLGSFGSVIVKIDPTSTPEIWYQPTGNAANDTLVSGGIVLSGCGTKLVLNDGPAPGLLTFDLTGQNGPARSPVLVAPKGFPTNFSAGADGLVAPAKYAGNVLLWSDDLYGTRVLATRDNWTTAEYLGLVPINQALSVQGAYTTDTFAVGSTLYALNQFFQTARPVHTLTSFHFDDITQSVQHLVDQWNTSSRW